MAASNAHTHEEPRARILLDKLAKAAGLGSGQALMPVLELALEDAAKAKDLGEMLSAVLAAPKAEVKPDPAGE